MKNKQNFYDRTGSSQDFSNNEGLHSFQDYTDSSFRNTPHYADRQGQRQDRPGLRSERTDLRSDYRAGGQSHAQPRSGYAASNTSDASMYTSEMPRSGYGQTSQNWNQGSQTSYPHRQSSSTSPDSQDWGQGPQFGSGSQYGANPQYGYGSGSFQSDQFDARYNANYGYGATSTPRHDQESSRFGQERKTGLHAGKGPKGYRRSDERIREEVSEALSAHGEIDASEIEIDVKEGMITLSGTVESRQIKRLVEDTVEAVSGVQDVKNDLRVMTSIENARSMSSESAADSTSARTSNPGKSGLPGRQSSISQSTSSGKSVQ